MVRRLLRRATITFVMLVGMIVFVPSVASATTIIRHMGPFLYCDSENEYDSTCNGSESGCVLVFSSRNGKV